MLVSWNAWSLHYLGVFSNIRLDYYSSEPSIGIAWLCNVYILCIYTGCHKCASLLLIEFDRVDSILEELIIVRLKPVYVEHAWVLGSLDMTWRPTRRELPCAVHPPCHGQLEEQLLPAAAGGWPSECCGEEMFVPAHARAAVLLSPHWDLHNLREGRPVCKPTWILSYLISWLLKTWLWYLTAISSLRFWSAVSHLQ